MAEFRYQDKDGNSEVGASASIDVNLEELSVSVGIGAGDGDGSFYTAYVPNHRTEIENLIEQLQAVLLASDQSDQPENYDAYSGAAWYAYGVGDEDDEAWGTEVCY